MPPGGPASAGRGGAAGSVGAAAGAAGAVATTAAGSATRKPLTIASVALAAATAWLAAVVTDSVTRYRSGPAAAITWRRDVLRIMSFCRNVPSMIDDGNPPNSASDASVDCQLVSCWLST